VFEIIFGGPYLSEIEGLADVRFESQYLFQDMSGYADRISVDEMKVFFIFFSFFVCSFIYIYILFVFFVFLTVSFSLLSLQ
jgi:hypothetical protein